jgi:hypothetical protein
MSCHIGLVDDMMFLEQQQQKKKKKKHLKLKLYFAKIKL